MFLGLVSGKTSARDSLQSATPPEIHPIKLAVVLGGSGALVTAAHLQNYNSWWKGERSAFHFGDVFDYALDADKLGHCYFTYLASDAIGHSLVWSGVPKERAFLYGASLSLAFQLYVEVEDGFTKALGFSPGDAVADVVGAFYPVLQSREPWLEGIRLKWSVIPSEKYQRGHYRTIVDDYESQYFWLSVNQSVFPEFIRQIIPPFVSVAIGYGVKNLDHSGNGERELYVGFDWDVTRLPGEGSFLRALKHVVNYFRLPAPTVRLTPSVIAYGLRF